MTGFSHDSSSLVILRINFFFACVILTFQHIANLAGNKTLVLPVPSFNVINGGSHAGNKLAMQVMSIVDVTI